MAGQQRRSGDLDQQKAQRTGLRQRAVQEGERGRDCRKRKVISHHRRRTRRHHSPKHNVKYSAWLWLNIAPKTTRYTFIFVVIAAQQARNDAPNTPRTRHKMRPPITRVRDKISMQTVLTALIFRHKQVEPQVYCQKSNRLLGQNIGS